MGERNKSRGQNRFGSPTSGSNNQEERKKEKQGEREKFWNIIKIRKGEKGLEIN